MVVGAFFDLDGTLIKGLVLTNFIDFLAKKGKFNPYWHKRALALTQRYREGKVSYGEMALLKPEYFARGLNGRKQAEINRLAEDFMAGYFKNLYPFSERLIRLMKSRGMKTYAISGSSIETVRLFKELGFDEVHGTRVKVENGLYRPTIETNMALGRIKKRLIDRIAARDKINLAKSHAFGDTKHDIPLFEKVAFPHPVNPNQALREEAAKRGWKILSGEELIELIKSSGKKKTRPAKKRKALKRKRAR